MKIIRETPYLIILKQNNILAFFAGIIMVAVGFLVISKPSFFTGQAPLWLGLIVIVSGVAIIFLANITTIILDKNEKKLVFKGKTLIDEKIKEYDLASIKQIISQEVHSISRRGGQRYSYYLFFVLDNGERIPFFMSRANIMRKTAAKKAKILGEKIATFLNVPFEERGTPTVNELLSTVYSSIQNAAQRETEKTQKGFAPIQIILSILAGTVIIGGIVFGVLYFTKQPRQQIRQGKCGDGVCQAIEKEKGTCAEDCADEKDQQQNGQQQNGQQQNGQQQNGQQQNGQQQQTQPQLANQQQSLDEINFHQLATGKKFGNVLKLFNPIIDEASRRLYVAGSLTTTIGVVDLAKDELVDVFDTKTPGGFLIFNNNKLYSFAYLVDRCYEIDVNGKKATEISTDTCATIVPSKEEGKNIKFGNYTFKQTGFQSLGGTAGFSADWRQDLNGTYGIIEIYNNSLNKKVGEIVHGPDALYFTIDSKTGKLYTTNTGDGSISIFDLNKLESTNYCAKNSCWVKDIDVGNSADEVIVDSSGNIYVRNRLGGSVIYKYNSISGSFTIIDNENHVSGGNAIFNNDHAYSGIAMWPTAMGLSKDEKRLYILSHYGALVDVVDTITNKVVNRIKFSTSLKPRTDTISAMAVDKMRDRIYAVWPELGAIGVADGSNGKILGTIDLTKYGFDKSKATNVGPGQINLAVDEKNGKLYSYVYLLSKLFVFNENNFSKEKELSVSLNNKGELLLKINNNKNKLYLSNKIFDLDSLKEIGTVQKGTKVDAFNNSANKIYTSELGKSSVPPTPEKTLKIYEFVDDIYNKDWHIGGLGSIVNTFFDFVKNVFYVADFIHGTVKKYDLSSGDVSSGGQSGSSSGNTPASLGGSSAQSNDSGYQSSCDLNKDGKVDNIEQQRCGQFSGDATQSQGRSGNDKCGDGICEDIEGDLCSQDCK